MLNVTTVSKPATEQQVEQDERIDRLIAVLERVLERQSQLTGAINRDEGTQWSRKGKVKPSVSCNVCGAVEHNTHYHCRANHLCFVCYAPDHTRSECPRAVTKEPRGFAPRAHQEGN